MARKSEPPRQPVRLTAPRSHVAADLDERIEAGEAIAAGEPTSPAELQAAKSDYYSWDEYNRRLLKSRFTTEEIVNEYAGGGFYISGGYTSFSQEVTEFKKDITSYLRRLRSIKDQLGLYEEPVGAPAPAENATPLNAAKRSTIFVVHGHNEERKAQVTVYLRQVTAMEIVILHEKASQSRTIIEKFEEHAARAVYAVVLLTGDDEGGPVGGATKLRARQNVVFEMGFFVGALGRSRVTVLYEADVELPSDMSGVLYVPLDAMGNWRFELAKELKAAGIEVDLNKAI